MKALRNLMLVAVVVGTMTVMSARSFAGPLLRDFPSVWTVGQAVAGQTTLPVYGDANDLVVDWIVVYQGGNVWGYYYQLENATGNTVSSFTISTLGGPPFIAAGILQEFNLDSDFVVPNFEDPDTPIVVKGHDALNYNNLGSPPSPAETENEPLGWSGIQDPIINPPLSPYLTPNGVTWLFSAPKLENGYQSSILYAYANMPPMYGFASANDYNATWRGGGIPVPSPEPSAVALVAIGALMGRLLTHRRSKK